MKAYKTRLDLNNKQRTYFNKCAGATRYVYNWGLAEWKRQHEAHKKDDSLTPPSRYGLCVQFNGIKDELCPWIREIPYGVTEAAFEALGKAFENYFRRLKKGEIPGYPKFKHRNLPRRFRMRGVVPKSDRVRIPLLGWARLSQSDYIPVDAKYGIYSAFSERAGHWYISMLVKDEEDIKAELEDDVLGIDFGLRDLAIISNGMIFTNPRPLQEVLAKIKRLDREMKRRTQGSENYKKSQKKRQRAFATSTDIREHTLHQISSYLTTECHPRAIVLEDLNVAGMIKNHNLALAIGDVGWGTLRRQIEYKAERMGIEVIIADQWFPSSKTCSRCGYVKKELAREATIYVCDHCEATIDRDMNAAYNLAAFGRNRQTGGDCLGS